MDRQAAEDDAKEDDAEDRAVDNTEDLKSTGKKCQDAAAENRAVNVCASQKMKMKSKKVFAETQLKALFDDSDEDFIADGSSSTRHNSSKDKVEEHPSGFVIGANSTSSASPSTVGSSDDEDHMLIIHCSDDDCASDMCSDKKLAATKTNRLWYHWQPSQISKLTKPSGLQLIIACSSKVWNSMGRSGQKLQHKSKQEPGCRFGTTLHLKSTVDKIENPKRKDS